MQFFQKNTEQSNRNLNSYNTKDEDFSHLVFQFIISSCLAKILIAPLIFVKVINLVSEQQKGKGHLCDFTVSL